MNNYSVEVDRRSERSAKRFWISLVFVLFAIQVTIGAVAIYFAVGNPSMVVIPDYHNAALNWDEHQHIHSAASRLGWTVQVDVSEVADMRGRRAVEVTITDQLDAGVDGLIVGGKTYHHARAADVSGFQLASIGGGHYRSLVSMNHAGFWEMELVIDGVVEPMQITKIIEVE